MVSICGQRTHQPPVGRAIPAQPCSGLIDGALHDGGRPIVQRMSERGRRMNPFQPELPQGKGPEKGGGDPQGMHGRTDIVHIPRQSQLLRAHPTADRIFRFEQGHGETFPGQADRRRKAVRARPHHHRIVRM